jgi:small subunit ribosomal protein S4
MKSFKGAKAKVVRRFGVNIFEADKYDRILSRKGYPPGVHGPTKKGSKLSEYGKQIVEKQKIKFMYGLTERQFRNFYNKAEKKKGATGLNLLLMLEARIDNVIFRSGWAATRAQARQIVNHGHVVINRKKSNIPSILVSAGDKIDMKKKAASRSLINSNIEDNGWRDVPGWIKSNHEESTIEIIRLPEREEIPKFLNEQLVVELYSK